MKRLFRVMMITTQRVHAVNEEEARQVAFEMFSLIPRDDFELRAEEAEEE